jgi:hypothetical protein
VNEKHIAVLRKAAAAVKDRGHEGDARLADSVLGIVASLSRTAPVTPAPQAAAEDGLQIAIEALQNAQQFLGKNREDCFSYDRSTWDHYQKGIDAILAATPAAAPVKESATAGAGEYVQLLRDCYWRLVNTSRSTVPLEDPLDGPVLRRIEAALAAASQAQAEPRLWVRKGYDGRDSALHMVASKNPAPGKDAWEPLYPAPSAVSSDARCRGLLKETLAVLTTWRDVVPAVTLRADIDAALSAPASSGDARDAARLDFLLNGARYEFIELHGPKPIGLARAELTGRNVLGTGTTKREAIDAAMSAPAAGEAK